MIKTTPRIRRAAGLVVALSIAMVGAVINIDNAAQAQNPHPLAAHVDPPSSPLPAGTFCNQTPTPPTPAGQQPGPDDYNGPTKVLQIFEENESSSAIDTNDQADASFLLDTLGGQCGVLSNMHAETHPSEPNYLDSADGGNNPNWTLCDLPPNSPANGCAYGAASQLTAPSIFSQVESAYGPAGWRIYGQSQTRNCQTTNSPDGLFAVRHNAAQYFTGLNCSADSIPAGNWQSQQGQFYTDVKAGHLPAYSLYTPNDTDDGHDPATYSPASTNIKNLDTALSNVVNLIQSGPDYQSGRLIVLVTFDEGTTTGLPPYTDARTGEDCTDPAQGDTKPSCQIVSYVAGRYVPWQSDNDFTTHYSLLKSTQQVLGLTPANGFSYLGHAGDMNIADFYRQFKLAQDSWISGGSPPNPPSVPSAPTGVAAAAGNGIAAISFTAPASSGGGSISSYTVTANPGGITATGPRSPVVLNGLSNGTSYTFTVAATNRLGTGPASAVSNAVKPSNAGGTNLLADPGFEAGTSGWLLFGTGSVNRVTTPVHTGTGALTAVPTGTTAGITGAQHSGVVTKTTAGQTYTVSCWIQPTKANVGGLLRLLETTSGYATVAVLQQARLLTVPTGTWTQLQVSGAALTTGDRVIPQMYAPNASTTNGYLTIDDCSFIAGLPPTVAVPGAPTNVTAAAGDGSAVVSFTAPGSTGGAAVTGYTVTSNPGGLTASGASSPITMPGLTNGTSYTFTVQATNSAGTGTSSTPSPAVTPVSTATAPGAPQNVVATAGDGQAAISFDAPATDGGSPITGYTVTSSPDGLTATGTASPLTVTGLTNGTAYTFTVTATNTAGTGPASDASTPVTPVAAPAPTRPGAAQNVVATAGDGQAAISFDPPATDGGAPITGYTVTSSPDGLTATGTTGPLTVTGLTNGTAYTFTVTATNTAGTGPASDASAPVTPVPAVTVPGTPTGLTAAPGNGQISLTWTAPTSTGGAAISDYVVGYRPHGTGSFTVYPDGVSTAGMATVLGLTNGSSYDFQVSAVNSAGTGAASAIVSAVPATVPDPPTAVTAVAGNAAATVSFTAPVNTGGSPVTGYTVITSPGNAVTTGSGGPITVTGLTNGTAYTFTVAARNAVGLGAASAGSAAVTPAAPAAELLTDPGFESGTGGWSVFSGGTIATTTSPVHGGAHALKDTAAAGSSGFIGIMHTGVISKSVAGRPYTVSCYLQPAAANLTVVARFLEYTSNYSSYRALTPTTTITKVATGSWTKISVTATALSANERMIPQLYSTNQAAAAASITYDDCSVTAG